MSQPSSHAHGGLLAMRVAIAAVFMWHGARLASDPTAAMTMFAEIQLPPLLGPASGWIAASAAFLLLVGFPFRPAAIVLAVATTGALVMVRFPEGMSPGMERDVLLLVGLLLLIETGPGRFALRFEPRPRTKRPRRHSIVEDEALPVHRQEQTPQMPRGESELPPPKRRQAGG